MNATAANRKVFRIPTLSTIGPAASTATADVSNSIVITQGSRLMRPRSSPMSGRTAVAAKIVVGGDGDDRDQRGHDRAMARPPQSVRFSHWSRLSGTAVSRCPGCAGVWTSIAHATHMTRKL